MVQHHGVVLRFVLLVLVLVGGCLVSCGDEAVETSTLPGSSAESGEPEEVDPESDGDGGGVTTSSDGSASEVEFYDEYRMAVDPLFQQAPGLIGSSYAFSWLDTKMEILVVSTNEPLTGDTQTALAELVPAELPIEYRIVENSAADLEATHQVISQNWDTIRSVTSFGTDPIANIVQVGSSDIDDTMARLLELGVDLTTVDLQPSGVSMHDDAVVVGRTGPIVVADYSDGAEDARLSGAISWSGDPGDCLTAGFGETEGVVWPAGTSWDDSTKEIVLLSGDRLAVGDTFTAGGGWHGTDATAAKPGRGWGLTRPVLDAAHDCGWTEFQYVQYFD